MAEKRELRGIAWDHPRGYEPLRATSKVFSRENPGVTITWDIRSLKAFGDMPIEDLIGQYDLITIDHPYMGQAHKNNLLLPLEKSLPKEALRELKAESVGPSFDTYVYNDHLYAVPIDAAAIVAASRTDLMARYGLVAPKTRSQLREFYQGLPQSLAVAWPLCATDLWCSFLSLCAQDGNRQFIEQGTIDEQIGSAVLNELKGHLEYVHPQSLYWNPIQVLDEMANKDNIVYCPFLFGYTNYSRLGFAKEIVHFLDSPANPKNQVSTILGGVGLAVSRYCEHPDIAAAYAHFVAKAQTQEKLYTENGGQPANIKAWQSQENNELCQGFFHNTQGTMERAYVRPRHPGWNGFQERGSELLHQGILKDEESGILMKRLNELYRSKEQ
ncbi:ABC transporter substrate-binding protein [Maribacter sp. 2307ULW6-5]|uniref:ABC transporter substrate-binding protein n=1 Tax=Maribacter sp. 2307ULW6-5 TaxID=3386275 RepID=UPI0039BC2888